MILALLEKRWTGDATRGVDDRRRLWVRIDGVWRHTNHVFGIGDEELAEIDPDFFDFETAAA